MIVPVVVDERARDRLRADRRGHARPRRQRSRAARWWCTRRRCRSAPPAIGSDRCSPRAAASSSTATCSSPSARSACSSAASSSTSGATRRSSAARARRARVARSSSIGPSLDEGTEVWAVANAETAEMTKLAETTYRDVNIAYANELARFAARRGIDVTEVIGAANSQPYSHIHQPGVGVGGHCIPVYPHFLFNGEPDLRLPPLAREINESMAALHGRHDRGPHRLARRPAGARARHRLPRRRATRTPSAPPSACATSCWPPARVSTATTRTSRPTTCASSASSPTSSAPAAGARRDPAGRARGVPVARPGRPARASSCFVDGRNALDREPFERAGVGYVGIGR